MVTIQEPREDEQNYANLNNETISLNRTDLKILPSTLFTPKMTRGIAIVKNEELKNEILFGKDA